ncbi:MAG TPA: hypothetical protein VLJ68_07710 [Chitinophagaceae bacterium]|nr:hypothetical protein [Chitinophagaceae bacterium]
MKKLQLFSIMLLSAPAFSQVVINVDDPANKLSNQLFYTVGKVPFSPAKYVRVVDGSPFFSETWMLGNIMTKDSTVYGDIRLRLDLMDGTLIYLNDKDEEMISVTPIIEVSLMDTITGKPYYFINNSSLVGIENTGDTKTWYQVLTGDAVPLYKQYFKDIYENKPYGSSVTEQTIRSTERYFIIVKKAMVRVKKLKEIPDILYDKRAQLLKFIDDKKLNGNKDDDFITLMHYYNSLK